MPYIGNNIRSADDYRLIDDISSGFNGSAKTFALQVGGSSPVPFPKTPQQCLISVNGVIQEPDPTGNSGFTLTGTNIVFSSAPTGGHSFFGIIYATADYLNAGGTFPDGAVGNPSITFTNDDDSGFYKKGSGDIGIVSNGTEIVSIDGNGLTVADAIIHGGDTNTKLRFPSNDVFTVETAGSERLRVASDGNTTLTGNLTMGEQLEISATTPNILFTDTNHNPDYRLKIDNGAFTIEDAGDNSDKFVIDSNGKVGIATSSPRSLLDLGAGSGDGSLSTTLSQYQIMLEAPQGSGDYGRNIGWSVGTNGLVAAINAVDVGGDDATGLTFITGNNTAVSERMRIDTSGNLLIGKTVTAFTTDGIRLDGTGFGVFSRSSTSTVLATGSGGNVSLANPSNTDNNFSCIGGYNSNSLVTSQIDFINVSQSNRHGAMAFLVHNGSTMPEMMRITKDGRVGIGTTSPDRTLHIIGDSGSNTVLKWIRGGSSNAGYLYSDGGGSGITGNDANLNNTGIYLVNNTRLDMRVGGSERLRIDSSGRLLIGTTSSRGTAGGNARLQVENTSTEQASFVRTSNDAGASVVAIGKTRNGSIVQNNDIVGSINFVGDDGTDLNRSCAEIKAAIDGTPGADDMPGRLEFKTTSDGSAVSTERLRIESDGDIAIKTNDVKLSGSGTLRINSGSTCGALNLDGGSSNHGGEINLLGGSNGGRIQFRAGQGAGQQSEKMRLDSNGRLLIATTSTSGTSASSDDIIIGSIGDSTDRGITFATTGIGAIRWADSGDNAMGRISYSNASDFMFFSTSNAERLRIVSGGNVGINQTNPNKARLHVVGDDTDGDIVAKFKSGGGGANSTSFIALISGYPDTANDFEGHAYIGVQRVGSGNQTKILFKTYSGDSGGAMRTRMTIEPGNNIDIQGKIHTQLGTQINSFNKETTGDQIRFNTTGTTRGSISSNGSTVSYNTTSDYRLKENEVAISDAITRLKALKPYRFNFKEEPSLTVDGFFAHEVTPVIPEAVNGEKDAMAALYYEEGDTLPEGKEIGDYKGLSTTEIQPQGLDQSKLVPLLTAALQEEISKREALEARIAALESA